MNFSFAAATLVAGDLRQTRTIMVEFSSPQAVYGADTVT